MAIQLATVTMLSVLVAISACAPQRKSYSGRADAASSAATANSQSADDIDENDPAADQDAKAEMKTEDTKSAPNSNDKLKPAANYCGSLGIVGGAVATVSDMVVKSTVRITFPNEYCTGTIIGPNQIITAAHCFKGDTGASLPPAVAAIGIEFGVQPKADALVKVKGFSVHPDYKGLGLDKGAYLQSRLFDVAIISFDGKIPEGYGIAPVGSTANLKSGAEITLAGYGAYSDRDTLARPLTLVKTAAAQFDTNFKEIQLQVGGGKGGCYGDSGGPSYIMSASGLCLNTLSTTTGPGRLNKSGLCTEGSATLMDITAYQGWMSCTFDKLGAPLGYLLKDESKDACDRSTVTK